MHVENTAGSETSMHAGYAWPAKSAEWSCHQRLHFSLPSIPDFPYHPKSEFQFPKRSFKTVSSEVSSL